MCTVPKGVHSASSPAEGMCCTTTELPREVAARGLASQGRLLEPLAKGLCALGAEEAVAQGLLPAAHRRGPLAEGAAPIRLLSAASQAPAAPVPSRSVCFGVVPGLAFKHLLYAAAAPLITSGY